MAHTDITTQNITTYDGILTYANSVTGGWLGLVIIFMVFLVSFLSLKSSGYDTKVSFATSSFFAALISVFLRVLGLIADKFMFIAIIAAAAGIIYLLFEGR